MATLAGKKIISVDEMSQEIDLKRYLGRAPTASEKRLFAEIAIEQINNRTLDGKTINGGKFKKYSKKYAEFKGVTRDSVDLFLEGDMLDSLDAEENGNKVKILIDNDLETKKGYNHHMGDTLPKRPWFGITTDEARAIANTIKEDVQVQEKKSFTLSDLQDALKVLGLEQIE